MFLTNSSNAVLLITSSGKHLTHPDFTDSHWNRKLARDLFPVPVTVSLAITRFSFWNHFVPMKIRTCSHCGYFVFSPRPYTPAGKIILIIVHSIMITATADIKWSSKGLTSPCHSSQPGGTCSTPPVLFLPYYNQPLTKQCWVDEVDLVKF